MQWLASAELAAAVSRAGGLGIISATRFMDNKPGLLDEFKKARELAEGKPFGVNISMLPHKDYSDCTVMFFEAAYEAHVPVIETSGRNPAEYIQMVREWEKADGRDNDRDRIKIIHKCPSVRHAVTAQKAGADAVTIVGFECAGHPGRFHDGSDTGGKGHAFNTGSRRRWSLRPPHFHRCYGARR